jgi:hypothetical protein
VQKSLIKIEASAAHILASLEMKVKGGYLHAFVRSHTAARKDQTNDSDTEKAT